MPDLESDHWMLDYPWHLLAITYDHWPCWFDVNVLTSGFLPFFEQKIKVLFKAFQGPFPIFQGLHSVQKRALSLSFFSFPHEQFYPEGLSIFAPFRHLKVWVAYTYSTEIQRLSSTSLNFQALFRLKFKDFQGVCDPCTTKGKQNWSLWRNFFHLHVLINSVQRIYQ